MLLEILAGLIIGIGGGLWLAREAKTELKKGKKWFMIIFIISIIAIIVVSTLMRDYTDYSPILGSLLLLASLTGVSYIRARQRSI